jgi:hypothetical protein
MDYLIKVYWHDGTTTTQIVRGKSESHALKDLQYEYSLCKQIKDLDGPVSFESLGLLDSITQKNYWQPTKSSRKRYWHPSTSSLTSLMKGVQPLYKIENELNNPRG